MKNKPSLENAYDLKSPEDNIQLYSVWADTYDADFIKKNALQITFLCS